MNETMETAVLDALVHEVLNARIVPATVFGRVLKAFPPALAPPRKKSGWQSSLCEADLQCLLQVIETELLPRLVSGYSPARCAPQYLRAAPD